MSESIDPMDVVRASPALHFAGCVRIENKDRELIHPKCNVMQEKMGQVYEACQYLAICCFMLVLKCRQSGGSTFSAEIVNLHMRNYVARAVCMADDYGNSRNLFRIFSRHVETDCYPWGMASHTKSEELHFSNGSWIEMDTAQNPKAGISATRNVAWMSEVAKYPSDGKRDAYATISNMIASVNKTSANSLVIAETTPEGSSGWFYDQWQKGVTLDEFLAGNKGNGWIKVFAAWHEFPEHSLIISEAERRAILDTLTPREKRGIEKYQWTPEQIAWRRVTLSMDCGGDEMIMDMHYPEDPESCFGASGRPRFDVEGMLALQTLAKAKPPFHGILTKTESGVSFRATAENESTVEIYEDPMERMRYLLVADTARSASLTRGADPDCHSVLILRAGYSDGERDFPIRVVARIRPPCRIDTDVLAEICVCLAHFYGKCLAVVERNAGESLIDLLAKAGINLYQETSVDMITSKTRQIFGWHTDAESKRRAVDRLAALVRQTTTADPKIIVDSHTADELRYFVIDQKGNCAAQNGKHDDDVMALAIGVACIEAATPYPVRIRKRQDGFRWKLS